MAGRSADRVTVPDVVRLPFHIGPDVASDAGVTLANPDPDGPPIAALTWPGLFYITPQSPAAGSTVYRWDSGAVETAPYGESASDVERTSLKPPLSDIGRALAERESFAEITDGGEPNPHDHHP